MKARYEFTILDVSKNKQNRVKSTFTQFKVRFKNSGSRHSWYIFGWGYFQAILVLRYIGNFGCQCISKPDHGLQAKPDSWGFRKFISTDFLKSRASQWLPEDNLTIVCDVSIIGENLALSCGTGWGSLDIHRTVQTLKWLISGGERTLSGSKFPEEGTRSQKPRHKCHKQVCELSCPKLQLKRVKDEISKVEYKILPSISSAISRSRVSIPQQGLCRCKGCQLEIEDLAKISHWTWRQCFHNWRLTFSSGCMWWQGVWMPSVHAQVALQMIFLIFNQYQLKIFFWFSIEIPIRHTLYQLKYQLKILLTVHGPLSFVQCSNLIWPRQPPRLYWYHRNSILINSRSLRFLNSDIRILKTCSPNKFDNKTTHSNSESRHSRPSTRHCQWHAALHLHWQSTGFTYSIVVPWH